MTSPERLALGDAYRQQQIRIRDQTVADVIALWSEIAPDDLVADRDRYTNELRALILRLRGVSAEVAARYYDTVRVLARAGGSFNAIQHAVLDIDRDKLDTSLRVTGPVTYRRSLRDGLPPSAASRRAMVAVAGAAVRHALDGGRETVVAALGADDRAVGWQRITDAKPCAFCAMLAGRGAVFKESTAGFQAHDHCGCQPEPRFRGDGPNPRNQAFQQLYDAAAEGRGEERLTSFRKAYRQQVDA